MRACFLFSTMLVLGCGTIPLGGMDSGSLITDGDAGTSIDASANDSGTSDAGLIDAGTSDAGMPDAGTDAGIVDLDLDGLDDAWEAQLAEQYLPVLSLHPQDGCPLGGIVFRLRPHPMDNGNGLLAVTWTYLFQRDCGITSHVGDNEGFGGTIDPTRSPETGLVALRAISHQNTLCERTTTCGSCGGLTPCERADAGEKPRLYSSKDKHGGYVSLSGCGTFTCLDTCAVGSRTGVPLVNAGEPNAPLTRNLSLDGGFITAANGWTEQSLFNFDPWGMPDFGGAGNVKGDLEDSAFLTPACR
ncbi:MAG: hypothetical protein JNM17_23860 [Archangium sp.]|nr:hypothetical protein [Archangium sp.]